MVGSASWRKNMAFILALLCCATFIFAASAGQTSAGNRLVNSVRAGLRAISLQGEDDPVRRVSSIQGKSARAYAVEKEQLRRKPELLQWSFEAYDPLESEGLPEGAPPELVAARSVVPDGLESRGDYDYYLAQYEGQAGPYIKALQDDAVETVGFIPNAAYLVRATTEQLSRIQGNPDTRFTGRVLPIHKVDQRLLAIMAMGDDTSRMALDPRGLLQVMVVLYEGIDTPAFAPLLKAMPGVEILNDWSMQNAPFGSFLLAIHPADLASAIREIAGLRDVQSVISSPPPRPLNDQSVWQLQSGLQSPGATNYDVTAPLFARGITGRGLIGSVIDDGLENDLCQFRYTNSVNDVAWQVGPDSGGFDPVPGEVLDGTTGNGFRTRTRKVVAYYLQRNAVAYSSDIQHGTTVSATMLADNNSVLAARPLIRDLGAEQNVRPFNSTPGWNTTGDWTVGQELRPELAPQVDDPATDTFSVANSFGTNIEHHQSRDGMAPGAQLVIHDIGDAAGGLVGSNELLVLYQAHSTGSTVSNHSYGTDPCVDCYVGSGPSIDRAMFDRRDLLTFVAAGNDGNLGAASIGGGPSQAKSAVVVGASENGASASCNGVPCSPATSFQGNDMADFSSRGPKTGGLLAPEISVPGIVITPAAGGLAVNAEDGTGSGDGGCGSTVNAFETGTSFASPTAAGIALLVQQYFQDGFYPSGVATATDRMRPTNALVRAVLVNSTRDMLGGRTGDTPTGPQAHRPSMGQGWGLPRLDDTLYFQGDPVNVGSDPAFHTQRARFAVLTDTPNGFDGSGALTLEPGGKTRDQIVKNFQRAITDGAVQEFVVNVINDDTASLRNELRITLAYTDSPGGSVTAPTVNDLDLEVIGPGPDGVLQSSTGANLLADDVVYRTNPLSAAWSQGYSVASGTRRLQATRFPFDATLPDKDSLNTVENVFIKPAEVYPGQYRIRVIGFSVPGGYGLQGARPNFVENDRPPQFDTDGDTVYDTDFEDIANSTDQGYALVLSGNFTATQGLISLNQASFGCQGEVLRMTLTDENGDAAPGPGCAGGIKATLTTTTPSPSFPSDFESVQFTGSQPTYRSLNPATGSDGFEVRIITDPADVIHGDGIIQIVQGETIQARYVDQNPCGGEAFAQASVGCQPAIDDSGYTIEDGCDYTVTGDPTSGVTPDQFMDRGEVARYTVYFVNNGGDDLHDVRVALVPDPTDPVSQYVHVLNSPQMVGLSPPGRRANATFLVQLDATTSIPAQHQMDFIVEVTSPADGLLYPDSFIQTQVLEADIESHRYDTRDPNGELFGFDRYRRLRRGVAEQTPPPNPPEDYEVNDPSWFDPDAAGAANCDVARNLWPNRNQPPASCPPAAWTGNDWDPWDFDDSNEGFVEYGHDADDTQVGADTPFLFNYTNPATGGGCGWEDQVHDEIATHGNPLPAGHPDLFAQPWGIWHTGQINSATRSGPYTPAFPGNAQNEGAPFFEDPVLGDRNPNDHTILWNATSQGGSDNTLGQWCASYFDSISTPGQYYRSLLLPPRLFRVHRSNPEYEVEFDELRFFSRMDGHTRNDDNWVAAGWFVQNQPVDASTPGPPALYSWGQFQYGTNIYTDKTSERWAVDDNDFTINLRNPNADFPDLTYEDIFGPAADQWNIAFGWTQVHFTGKKGNGQYGWGLDDVSFVWRETREVADQSDCAALVPSGPPATISFAEQRYNACQGTFQITLIDQTQTLPQVAVAVTSAAENFEIAILTRGADGRYRGSMDFTTDTRNDAVGVLLVAAGTADIGDGGDSATVEYDPDEAAIAGPRTQAEAEDLADWQDLDGNGNNDDTDGDGIPDAEDDRGRERTDTTSINCTSGRIYYVKSRVQQVGATGDGDRFPDHGERMLMAVTLVSDVGADLDDVTVRISTDDPIYIVNDEVRLNTLPGNRTVTETPLEFEFCVPTGFKTTDVANPRTISFRIDVTGTNTANLNAFSTQGDSFNTWLPMQAILLADVDEVATPVDYDDNRAPTRTGRPIGTYYEGFEGAAAGANGLDHPFISLTEPGTPPGILQDTTLDTRFGMAGNGGFCPECDFQTDCALGTGCDYQFSNDATNGYPSTLASNLEWALTQAPNGWAYRGVGAYKFGDPSSNASQQEQHYSKGQYISLQLPPLRISNDPNVTPEMSWWQIVDMWPPNFTSGLSTTIDGCVVEIAPSTVGVGDTGTGADRRNRSNSALISPTSPTTRYPLSNFRRVSPYEGVYDYETDVLNACRALFCQYKHPVFSVIGSPEAQVTDEHAGTPGTPGAWYESRIDLSDFRGQEIVIQFSAEVMQDLDIQPGSIGWFLDEIRVTGVSNRIGIRAQTNQITNDQCGIQADYAAPNPACFGSEVQFLDRHQGVGLFDSATGQPYPIQYEWSIGSLNIPRGDAGVLVNPPIAGVFGTYDNPRVNLQVAAGVSSPGTVPVTMRIYQNGTLVGTKTGSIVYKDAPVPVITATPNPAFVDGVTRFDAAVTVNGSLDPTRTYIYEWNFGDGSPIDASGPSVNHQFASLDGDPTVAGNQPFDVTVRVFDEDGCVGESTLSLVVNAAPVFTAPVTTFVDDCAGGGPTEDGNADLNEYITMNIAFRNGGTTAATSVVGYLSSPDVLVEVTGAAASYGDVAAGATSPARPYTFIRRDDGSGASSCLVIPFQLTLVSNTGSVIQVLDLSYTMGNAAEVTHSPAAAGPQSFCFQDPTDPTSGSTVFLVNPPTNGCLDGLEMRLTLTTTARALMNMVKVEVQAPDFRQVTILPTGYAPNNRGPYVIDFAFNNDATGPVPDTGGVVTDNSGAANTLEDGIQADLPSQLLGAPMVGAQPWRIIVSTTSPGTCADGTFNATLNVFDLEGNSSGDLEVATEPPCGSCITGSAPVFSGARSECAGSRVVFNPAIDTSSCNGVSDVTYELWARRSSDPPGLGTKVSGTAREVATLDCASYPDQMYAARRLTDATWWDVCNVESVYWTVIAVDASGQRTPNISTAGQAIPAGYETTLQNCALPITEGIFAIVKGGATQATIWLDDPPGIPTWSAITPPGNVSDYRLLRGTFPTAGGVLKTLGYRASPTGNNCGPAPGGAACRDAAYDHNAVACAFTTISRDISADMTAPGSFYYLVAGANSGGCFGMGYRATPGASAGTLAEVEEIPGFGPGVTPNPSCPVPCDSP